MTRPNHLLYMSAFLASKAECYSELETFIDSESNVCKVQASQLPQTAVAVLYPTLREGNRILMAESSTDQAR